MYIKGPLLGLYLSSMVSLSILPLLHPTTFSGEDYVASGKSEAIDIKIYQTIVGDLAYLTMTRFEVLFPLSAVSQKTHYCSMLDYDEAIRIVQ
jgi:hypothetical protein